MAKVKEISNNPFYVTASRLAGSYIKVFEDENGKTVFENYLPPTELKKELQPYGEWLSAYQDWTHFVTLTTRYELTLRSARRLAERYFKELARAGDCRMFFACEPFDLKEGFHLHALMKVSDMLNTKNLAIAYQGVSNNKKLTKKNWNRISLERYDKTRGAGYYVGKYITKQLSDYDMLGK